MINAEFLSQCSDEKINKGVAWCRVKEFSLMTKGDKNEIDYWAAIDIFNRIEYEIDNYCTNHNDIMPIAFANRIDIRHDYDVLESVTALIGDEDDYLYWATNTNPLRAICEVYILMSVNK
tara:strand:- start:7899 stop:8258 length:360 start_codon:yes stop_codon:yes gene_type:complete